MFCLRGGHTTPVNFFTEVVLLDSKQFLMGMGLGMLAGGAVGRMLPRKQNPGKHMVSRALRSMGDVIDEVSTVIGK